MPIAQQQLLFVCFYYKNARLGGRLHIVADVVTGGGRLIVAHILPHNAQPIHWIVHKSHQSVFGREDAGVNS